MPKHSMRKRHRASAPSRENSRHNGSEARVECEYVVQEGDSLMSIARAHRVPMAALLALNGLSWSTGVSTGQRLSVPGTVAPAAVSITFETNEIQRHVIGSGETISAIAAHYDIEVNSLLSANGLHRSSLIFVGQTIIIPPKAAETGSVAARLAG